MPFPFDDELRACTRCKLARTRQQVVIDRGNEASPILFIAEAPGETEDRQGWPLCGRSGQIYNKALRDIFGFERGEVFTTNTCQCRPPKNRDPEPDELAACSFWVRQQILCIEPKVIVPLGRFAMYHVLGTDKYKISEAHGKFFEVKYVGLDVLVCPTFHPSACIYHRELYPVFLEDLKRIKARLVEDNMLKPA